MIIGSLFSAALFVGNVSHIAFADETLPGNPDTPPNQEIMPAPAGEDTTPNDPVLPPDTGENGSSGGDTGIITPPDMGNTVTSGENTAGIPSVDTQDSSTAGGTTSSDMSSSTTDTGITEQSTTQSETTESQTDAATTPQSDAITNQDKVEKTKDENKQTDTQTTAPAKQVTVSVNPQGQITTDTNQGTSVPIITSNISEISHVPTPTTPLKVSTGQTIVGVLDGIPLVQNEQGELIKDPSIPVKVLKSGNIEVKTADGKTKILPKTGEEINLTLSLVGSLCTLFSGFIWWKKRA